MDELAVFFRADFRRTEGVFGGRLAADGGAGCDGRCRRTGRWVAVVFFVAREHLVLDEADDVGQRKLVQADAARQPIGSQLLRFYHRRKKRRDQQVFVVFFFWMQRGILVSKKKNQVKVNDKSGGWEEEKIKEK